MFACRNIEVGEEILFDYGCVLLLQAIFVLRLSNTDPCIREGFAAKFDLIKLDANAQPKIEHRRKGVAYAKLPDKVPTLSKNGKRIGRPRKNAPSDQGGVKENIVQSAAASTSAPVSRKKSHKRKRSPPQFALDGAADEADNFDDVLLSDDVAENVSSSESFHESDDEDARVRRRRRAKAAKVPATRKRGWRTKVGKRGGRSGRGERAKTESGFGPPEGRTRGDKSGTTQKHAFRSRAVNIEQVDGASRPLQELFDRGPLPARRGQKTRHPATDRGKEVNKGANSDIEMESVLSPDTLTAAAFVEEHHAKAAPKRALKSYANMQKKRDVRSLLKYRRRGG